MVSGMNSNASKPLKKIKEVDERSVKTPSTMRVIRPKTSLENGLGNNPYKVYLKYNPMNFNRDEFLTKMHNVVVETD